MNKQTSDDPEFNFRSIGPYEQTAISNGKDWVEISIYDVATGEFRPVGYADGSLEGKILAKLLE